MLLGYGGSREGAGTVDVKSRTSLRRGESPSKAARGPASWKSKLWAKAVCAAWVRRADHRAMNAWAEGCWRGSASTFGQQPDELCRFLAPTAPTFECHKHEFASAPSLEFRVNSFFCPSGIGQSRSCVCPSSLAWLPGTGERHAKVVSTASWAPWCKGSPLAIT